LLTRAPTDESLRFQRHGCSARSLRLSSTSIDFPFIRVIESVYQREYHMIRLNYDRIVFSVASHFIVGALSATRTQMSKYFGSFDGSLLDGAILDPAEPRRPFDQYEGGSLIENAASRRSSTVRPNRPRAWTSSRAFRHYYPRDMQIAYYTRCIALRRVTRLARGVVRQAFPRLGLTRHPRQLASSPPLARPGRARRGGRQSLKTHTRHARPPRRANVAAS